MCVQGGTSIWHETTIHVGSRRVAQRRSRPGGGVAVRHGVVEVGDAHALEERDKQAAKLGVKESGKATRRLPRKKKARRSAAKRDGMVEVEARRAQPADSRRAAASRTPPCGSRQEVKGPPGRQRRRGRATRASRASHHPPTAAIACRGRQRPQRPLCACSPGTRGSAAPAAPHRGLAECGSEADAAASGGSKPAPAYVRPLIARSAPQASRDLVKGRVGRLHGEWRGAGSDVEEAQEAEDVLESQALGGAVGLGRQPRRERGEQARQAVPELVRHVCACQPAKSSSFILLIHMALLRHPPLPAFNHG